MKQLIIVRGLPGSGKTTFAKTLDGLHFEADQYFMRGGVYEYDREKIKDAHEWCQDMVRLSMLDDYSTIVVSNTFVKRWEIQPYLDMASKHGYRVTEITMSGSLHGSIHGIPEDKIQLMAENWEK